MQVLRNTVLETASARAAGLDARGLLAAAAAEAAAAADGFTLRLGRRGQNNAIIAAARRSRHLTAMAPIKVGLARSAAGNVGDRRAVRSVPSTTK